MKLLKGKTALVTGASRGIGTSIALKFAEHGANVAFTYRSSKEKAEVLKEQIQQLGVECDAYQSDAGSFQQTEKLIVSILEKFGELNVVVNNAGITLDNLLLRMSEDQWDKVIETNLKSVFNVTKNVTRQMLKQRGGSIINISSVVGVGGNAGQANYAASKAGVIGFTKSIAKELGTRNIRCNAIAPGFIETDMTDALGEEAQQAFLKEIPLRRLGATEEIANAALFLASDMSSYITGQTLSVCGGLNT